MKNLCPILLFSAFLISDYCFSQSPGIFNLDNNTSCSIDVRLYAYDGTCGNVDCRGGPQGNTGWITVNAHSTKDLSAGYGGGGTVWAYYEVNSSSNTAGDVSCSGWGTGTACSGNLTWVNCHHGTIP